MTVPQPTIRSPRSRTFRRLALAAVLALGGLLLALADRYLIPHVEAVALPATPTASASGDATPTVSADATGTSGTVVSTATDYVSDDLAIHITKVVTGTGNATVTYCVADVTVSDISLLLSAFPNDTFGRNITADTSVIAAAHDALFAINGDYFGFRADGVEIRNGVLYRDEPARVGAVIYADGTMDFYDETRVTSAALLADGALQTLSFGPVLVDDGVVQTDFAGYRVDTNMGNASSIAGSNPRTGIGMISANHYVFVVVDGRSPGYSAGLTLAKFAQVFQDLGCTQAYNLDGGGSSTMVFRGAVVNDPLGRGQERGVSDILYIREE